MKKADLALLGDLAEGKNQADGNRWNLLGENTLRPFLILFTTGALTLLCSCGGDTSSSGEGSEPIVSANSTKKKAPEPSASSTDSPAMNEPKLSDVLTNLVEQCGSADEFDRIGAIMELATKEGRDHPTIQRTFLAALNDSSADVKAEAAKALPSVIGQEKSTEALIPLLKDPDTTVRKAAIEGLANTGNASAAKSIAPCLRDPQASVQLEALSALARLKNPAVISDVKPLLFDPDGTKIRAAIQTVVALDGKTETETIRGLLMDMNSDVRSSAAQALGSLDATDKKSLMALTHLLTDDLMGVRKSASESLTSLTKAEIEYFYDEADQESLKEGAKLWEDWIEKNK